MNDIHNLRDFTNAVVNIAKGVEEGAISPKENKSNNILRNPSNGEGHQVSLEKKLDETYKKLSNDQRIHLKNLFDNADKQLTPTDKEMLKRCLVTMGSPKNETPFSEHLTKGILKRIGLKNTPSPSALREGHEIIQNIKIIEKDNIKTFYQTIYTGIGNGSIINAGGPTNEKGMPVAYNLDPLGGELFADENLFNEVVNDITEGLAKILQKAGFPSNAKISNIEIALERRTGQYGEHRVFCKVLVTSEDGPKYSAEVPIRVFDNGGKKWEVRADAIINQEQNALNIALQLRNKMNK